MNTVIAGNGKRFDLSKAVYFTPTQQALNAEIVKHPELMEHLRKHPSTEFEIRMAEVARFCGILLDGMYNAKDIDNICALCLDELRKRSTMILLPFS